MNLSRPAHWNVRGPLSIFLLPLSLLFRGIAWLRRQCYRVGLLSSWKSPVPIIVVGNITVGGAGKTPLVMALTELLQSEGYKVGIISRGYGGDSQQTVTVVHPESDPKVVGDESVVLASRTGVPVVVGSKRVEVVKKLLGLGSFDFIISDDGLQHYALGRHMEIVVIDSDFTFGNGFCLPAGPLREPVSRLKSVDLLVYSGSNRTQSGYTLAGSDMVNMVDHSQVLSLDNLHGSKVHAVAGIASPSKFFDLLRSHGLIVIEHPFADHAVYRKEDLEFDDAYPVLMTEKDMVKCRNMNLRDAWYVPVDAILDEHTELAFKQLINNILSLSKNSV